MIESGPVRGHGIRQGDHRPSADTKASASRALVAIDPIATRANVQQRPAPRSSAAFLAQVIATAGNFPQTREKRRLDPEEAVRLYVAAQSRVQPRRARLASL